ncbi:MAG: hypothetical protein JOY59_14375 [Candidatus Eremiobacteraeota bacterium]|nr:hypothetical protein [Candidatus Eremiobacteraeota bacterium]
MLRHAIALGTPASIRYPRGSTSGKHLDPFAPLEHGKAEILREGSGVALLALGNSVDEALDAYDLIVAEGGRPPTVVNARFVKPLDAGLVCKLALTHDRIITLEEHSLDGGLGSAVVELLSDRGITVRVERVGAPNILVQANTQPKQRALVGLSGEALAARIRSREDIREPTLV